MRPQETRRSSFITIIKAVAHTRLSAGSNYAKTVLRAIRHRRLPGVRKLIYIQDERDAWLRETPLEWFTTPDGLCVRRQKQITTTGAAA